MEKSTGCPRQTITKIAKNKYEISNPEYVYSS